MIVADDALYMKRRPSDLLYTSSLLESIDEPLRVKRIQDARMIRPRPRDFRKFDVTYTRLI